MEQEKGIDRDLVLANSNVLSAVAVIAILGLMVVPVDGRLHGGFGRALARGALIAVVIPALITDRDLRGIQDRVTNTAVVRR